MELALTVLGANAGKPARGRHPSAHILSIGQEFFLIDCGEGTQMQMTNYGVRANKINHIFISHLHGDHVFGLAGLITSYNHLNRKSDLHIYGTPGIQEMILTQLRLSGSRLLFNLIFHEYDIIDRVLILDLAHVRVFAFPLMHRIPTIGYFFEENIEERPLRIHDVNRYQIDVAQYNSIKRGMNAIDIDGNEIDFRLLTDEPIPSRSFAYCSDTTYDDDIISYIQDVDLLYHEATFMHDLVDKAIATKHTTALQASQKAKQAGAKHLLLGHYSSRYHDVEPIEKEAKTNFPNSICVREGVRYELHRDSGIIIHSPK